MPAEHQSENQSSELRLAKGSERRLRAGHCWVYSNEVDNRATPLKQFEPGQAVDIVSSQGKWLGSGYINPHTLICARLVSRDRAHALGYSLLVHRLQVALSLREGLYATPHYRLVFGESDGLPGLVVDRFGEVLVVQITTAGMESLKDDLVRALEKVLRPATIILRNDVGIRELEGLPLYQEMVGAEPGENLSLQEGEARFEVPASAGQKTGWFFDQAFNRDRLVRYARGARVLDVCSYVGGWGIRAALAGADSVVCLDSSARALDAVQSNAQLNGVAGRVSVLQGDAFDQLRQLREAKEKFDLVLLDPPAFIKRRKDAKEGTLAYRRLNQLGLQLCSRDGRLVTSSCSHHMSGESLLEQAQIASRATERSLQLLEQGAQAPDHPVHPAMPETAYLKTFFLRVLPSF